MENLLEKKESADLRLALYKGIRQFLLLLILGLVVKLLFLDSVVIKGVQMNPGVKKGERIVIFKTPYLPGLKTLLSKSARGKPVVSRFPDTEQTTFLRIAAISGDTATVDSGSFYIGSQTKIQKNADDDVVILPPDYSPRDFMHPYRVPAPGDKILFDTLSLRDFFFSFSALRQENPKKRFDLEITLIKNDTASKSYFIKDFVLYRGRLDSIPKPLQYDWYFWDRLQKFLEVIHSGEKPRLQFAVFENGSVVEGFRIRSRFVFLLADNWQGAVDSRYFGPVISSHLKGRPLMSLWQSAEDSIGRKRLRFNSFGRIIH